MNPIDTIEATPAVMEKLRLRLIDADGSYIEVEAPHEIRDLVRLGEKVYEYRGTDQIDGRWLRLYRETKIDVLKITPAPADGEST
jgi:hypothetical protein